MHVVSDADVLIHLSKLEKLSILKILYIEIAIPEYIKSEILRKDSEDIQDAIYSFLKVFNTSDDEAQYIAKEHGIHIGEAHVKLLGEQLKASLFLSNERKVRKAAKEEGLNVAGTIGIILKGVKERAIDMDEAMSLLQRMKSKEFRIHPDIIQKSIQVLEEF